jgi:hypothetical protein
LEDRPLPVVTIDRPARRRARADGPAPVAGLRWVAAILGVGAVLLRSGILPGGVEPSPPQPATLTVGPPDWVPIPRATPLFVVAAPELRGVPLVHTARAHRDGGREDVLTYGAFSGDGLHLRLAIRAGDPAARPESFFVDLVRHAAEAGYAVIRSGGPGPLPTKLGPVETADVGIEETVERACVAFRSDHPQADLRLAGWACGTPERPADRQLLACLLDRLAVRPGADHRALRAFLAAADETRLPACHTRTSWLEAPLLRGSLAPRP